MTKREPVGEVLGAPRDKLVLFDFLLFTISKVPLGPGVAKYAKAQGSLIYKTLEPTNNGYTALVQVRENEER